MLQKYNSASILERLFNAKNSTKFLFFNIFSKINVLKFFVTRIGLVK